MVHWVHLATEETIPFLAVLAGDVVAFFKFKRRAAAFRTKLHMFEFRAKGVLLFYRLRAAIVLFIFHECLAAGAEVQTTSGALYTDMQIDFKSALNGVGELNQIGAERIRTVHGVGLSYTFAFSKQCAISDQGFVVESTQYFIHNALVEKDEAFRTAETWSRSRVDIR